MKIGNAATFVGLVVLLRCAWAVSQYRDMLKLTQQEFTGLPQHLQLELLIGTALCLIGGFIISGGVKPIVISRGAPSVDTGSSRAGFIQVNHRGKALPLPPFVTS
ncbi:hypothetical protein OEZ85_006388 [Tetradesmus obliquus]|uniref:Membrane magnesium transporter n=1 Tax=Tetradesmus obliquus TaxID=3088 RepID=A0ABY8TZ63_TETOB|nr:hypothetical protein OEZ85_006388 [Tetradesmus obliquus]